VTNLGAQNVYVDKVKTLGIANRESQKCSDFYYVLDVSVNPASDPPTHAVGIEAS